MIILKELLSQQQGQIAELRTLSDLRASAFAERLENLEQELSMYSPLAPSCCDLVCLAGCPCRDDHGEGASTVSDNIYGMLAAL